MLLNLQPLPGAKAASGNYLRPTGEAKGAPVVVLPWSYTPTEWGAQLNLPAYATDTDLIDILAHLGYAQGLDAVDPF